MINIRRNTLAGSSVGIVLAVLMLAGAISACKRPTTLAQPQVVQQSASNTMVAPTGVAAEFLMTDCDMLDTAMVDSAVRASGPGLVPAYRWAFLHGMTPGMIQQFRNTDSISYVTRVAQLTGTHQLGLTILMADSLRLYTVPRYVERELANLDRSYRSRAIIALGLTQDTTMRDTIQAMARDSNSIFHTTAVRALNYY